MSQWSAQMGIWGLSKLWAWVATATVSNTHSSPDQQTIDLAEADGQILFVHPGVELAVFAAVGPQSANPIHQT